MRKLKKINILTHHDEKGKLTPITFNKTFPIKVKRVFLLYGKKNKTRGNHAHKKCSQLFIPIFGKFILDISTPKKSKKIILDHKKKIGFLVPPKYWCKIKFLNKNSVIMVACDKYYDSKDYINDFYKYKKYLG